MFHMLSSSHGVEIARRSAAAKSRLDARNIVIRSGYTLHKFLFCFNFLVQVFDFLERTI